MSGVAGAATTAACEEADEDTEHADDDGETAETCDEVRIETSIDSGAAADLPAIEADESKSAFSDLTGTDASSPWS